MTSQAVNESQLIKLRDSGLISENEIALIEGDILLAKNVLTEERRIIGKSSDLIKENTDNRRILKG
tara:strand:+ start:185 stop:382 length:198 start_codon:yes stop_codon:yes gene_type:complete